MRHVSSRLGPLLAAGSLGLLVLGAVPGCGSDAASDGIAFHGEAAALPGFSYDTGLVPAGSPAQVSLKLSAGGPIVVDAEGVVTEGKLAGKPQSGKARLDVHVKLEGRLKIDSALKKYDDVIPGLSNLDVPIVAEAPFDPFLLDGGSASVNADIPETKLPDVPLGGVPGTLKLTVVAGSKLTAKYSGACMAVSGGKATHTGLARVAGTLILRGELALDLPAPLNKTIPLADITIPIPEGGRLVPFTPVAVSSVSEGETGPACSGAPATDGGLVAPDGGPIVTPDGAPACNASNCAGCCRDGACLSGATPAACGKPGEACESCSGPTDCVARECKATACGPDNCSGCCQGTACLFGDSSASCGRAGQTCVECAAGSTCDNGTCVSASCKSTCTAGCCSGATCNPGNTVTACGKAGDACATCGAGRTCTAGACLADQARPFDLVMVGATLPATDKNGSAWDFGGGLPDPYVKVVLGARTGQSPYAADTRTPTWSFVALAGVPARELKAPITLEFWDDDVAADDFIGGCIATFTDAVFDGALHTGTCAASATGVALTYTYKLVPR